MDQDKEQVGRRTFTFSRTFRLGDAPPIDPDDPAVTVVPGPAHTFRWQLGGEPEAGRQQAPRTYYEAFTGEPHPATDMLVSARRFLDLALWAIALGFPAALVVLGIVNGEPLETIVLMGAFGAGIGLLFRHSFPRTPFG